MKSDSENPYHSPQAALPETGAAEPVSVRQIFWRWERWRLVYNAIVGLIGLAGIAMFPRPPGLLDLMGATLYALGANVCYLLGPGVEAYLQFLGFRRPGIMPVLFILGTLFSVLLTLVLVAAAGFVTIPNQN